ncbi:MAG: S49 family peptidase [Candidatus Obscuribacterales bacterium]|nr:S49 family peptidase [Candidatus Obscuribacterales bacterium]
MKFLAEVFSPVWKGIKIAVTAVVAIFVFLFLFAVLLVGGDSEPSVASSNGLSQAHKNTVYTVKRKISVPAGDAQAAAKPAASTAQTLLTKSEKPVAVLRYNSMDGEESASAFASLVDEVVLNRSKFGGVLVLVDCPGGAVTEYGLLYAEMLRIKKEADLPLVVCVDQVAASGGYLMILPADHIVAAPFSVIGSIGVVSEMLNYHDALEKLGVKSVTMTAGKFKRTVTPTDEVTEEGKALETEKLKEIHKQFIAKVTAHRKGLDPDKACNANTWSAEETVNQGLGLVDELGTSHDLLFKLNGQRSLVYISSPAKIESWSTSLTGSLTDAFDRALLRLEERLFDSRSKRNQPKMIAP